MAVALTSLRMFGRSVTNSKINNRVYFALGTLTFVAGLVLFSCSCACGLSSACVLLGFGFMLLGIMIDAVTLWKNYNEFTGNTLKGKFMRAVGLKS